MKLSQFKFKLPEEQIAQHPTEHRDEARLMVLHKDTGDIEHVVFKDIINYFDDRDLFMFNDTRVFPAKMCGSKDRTDAVIAAFLLRELNPTLRLWDILVDPARKIRVGNKLYFGKDRSLVAEVIDNTTSRGRTVRFLYDGSHEDFKRDLFALGETPLPSHIKRPVEAEDAERYQTIFAGNEGAVVAPAAGLHFSRELLKRLEIKGVNLGYVTLHCSLSLFREIDVEDLTKHKLDSEQIEVNDEAVTIFNHARNNGRQICAIGTSVLRTLETAVTTNGEIKPYDGWTNRFIFPPYAFQTATSLVTNFHLPLSTMLMNTAAFGGYEKVMSVYNIAVKEGYRFGFYGDALLII
ncbi:MAG: tRNA preQ1(34) S-adenosylmethionine ribosyltransferase-isomerase QueA [Prevotellaceae bacterium]|jgi:S-adenosylmethionine:tRNA ribosyltransferase-isomerase|nr:tRNA preQ1(34) S-adenosylmethionine ribosyltransferase-isomerase QueA [Prevotellaceae bacterium]